MINFSKYIILNISYRSKFDRLLHPTQIPNMEYLRIKIWCTGQIVCVKITGSTDFDGFNPENSIVENKRLSDCWRCDIAVLKIEWNLCYVLLLYSIKTIGKFEWNEQIFLIPNPIACFTFRFRLILSYIILWIFE